MSSSNHRTGVRLINSYTSLGAAWPCRSVLEMSANAACAGSCGKRPNADNDESSAKQGSSVGVWVSQPGSNMWVCQVCKVENEDSLRWCQICGTEPGATGQGFFIEKVPRKVRKTIAVAAGRRRDAAVRHPDHDGDYGLFRGAVFVLEDGWCGLGKFTCLSRCTSWAWELGRHCFFHGRKAARSVGGGRHYCWTVIDVPLSPLQSASPLVDGGRCGHSSSDGLLRLVRLLSGRG